jgi:hypothetical protein
MVRRSQPGQIVWETLSQKNPSQKKGWWSLVILSSNPSTAKKSEDE